MTYYDWLTERCVALRETQIPNFTETTSEGIWVIVEKRDRTERCRFLVDHEDYEKLVRPFRWNAGGVDDNRIYTSAAVPTGSKNSTVLLARWLVNPPQELEVDHINLNTFDNRRGNLRVTTRKQNEENQPASKWAGASKHRGVFMDMGRWRAQVTHNYKAYKSSRFDSEEDAAEWARQKRAELFTHNEEACL